MKKKNTSWERACNLFNFKASLAALVIIDMQNFSCSSGKDALPGICQIISRINNFVVFCRKKNIPVIWVRQNITADEGKNDGGLFPLFHDRKHTEQIMNACEGTEIYKEMNFDSSQDYVVFKNRYSAFLSTPPELQNKLKSLQRTQLMIAGVAANVCVESTVRDAMQLDYEVVLLSDGIAATDEALLESTLANTAQFFGDVRNVEEMIQELQW